MMDDDDTNLDPRASEEVVLIENPQHKQDSQERISEAYPTAIGRPISSRSRLDSVGIANLAIALLGLLVSSIIAAFICFLWAFSPGCGHLGRQPQLWRSIVLPGRLPTILTFAVAFLRITMGLQAGVAFSVIAGLALERRAVPLCHLPLVLALRGTGVAPTWSVAEYSWRALRLSSLTSSALLLLIVTGSISQFSSALLLSDVGLHSVLNNSVTGDISFGFRYIDADQPSSRDYKAEQVYDVSYWNSELREFPLFSEYSKPLTTQDLVLYDTGVTLRAFLPFNTEHQRESLYKYQGYTSIIDTRFTCIAPSINATGMFLRDNFGPVDRPTRHQLYLEGLFSFELPPHMYLRGIGEDPRAGQPVVDETTRNMTQGFNCSVALPRNIDSSLARSEWAVSICEPFDGSNIIMDSPLVPQGRAVARQYLVFNTTQLGNEWGFKSSETTFNWTSESSSGPWGRLSYSQKGISISMSLCVTPSETVDIEVVMVADGIGSEPMLEWDSEHKRYNASRLQRLYAGATEALGRRERGVLSLEKRKNWTEGSAETNPVADGSPWYSSVFRMTRGSSLCTFCESHSENIIRVHRTPTSIFQYILQSSGNLPFAMQSLWTILAQSKWYHFLPQFTVSEPGSYEFFGEALVPIRWTGLIVVLTVICVHSVAVLFTVLLFLSQNRASQVGNLWQALGQVSSGDVADFASKTSLALDKEVVQHLEREDKGKTCVELVYDAESRVSKLLRRRIA